MKCSGLIFLFIKIAGIKIQIIRPTTNIYLISLDLNIYLFIFSFIKIKISRLILCKKSKDYSKMSQKLENYIFSKMRKKHGLTPLHFFESGPKMRK